jgi:TatD DNase family protein
MIDFHCHLDSKDFEQDLEDVINRALENNVKYLVCPSVNINSSLKVIKLASKYNFIIPLIGIHPHEVKNLDLNYSLDKLRYLIETNNFKGIGEIGLDYYYDENRIFKDKQIAFFEKQLELAEDYNLPVFIHIRDSFDDVYSIIKNFKVLAIWHSFTGDYSQIEKFLSLGGYFSISGIITFKNKNKQLIEVVKEIPFDKILIETDSPYLAPEPFRGRRNEPQFVNFIYLKVCEIKGINLEELEKNIDFNFLKIFKN